MAVAIAAIVALAACGSSVDTAGDGDADSAIDSPGVDVPAGGDTDAGGGTIGDPIGAADANTGPDPGPIGGGGGGDDSDASDATAGPGDDAGDIDDPGPSGAFGDPCNGNSDCLSGWCVEGVSGYICTKTCDLTCPEGFDCKAVSTGQDVVFLCMPRLQKLCTPCSAAIHCPGGACLVLDGEGRCGYDCEDDTDCPVGYGCLEDPDGVEAGTFCQPLTGSCACNASTDGGQRTCSEANELGECYGVQTCHTTDGWGECSATQPALESCDGLDNDCNGLVDEALEGIGDTCQNEVAGVGACDGVLTCNGPNGLVCTGPVPEVEACDFKDNDCDGLVDEDFQDAAGDWTTDAHCGGCFNDCSIKIEGGTGVCGGTAAAPICVVESCDEGFVKLNDYQCGPQPDVSCVPCSVDADCFGGSCVDVDGQSVCVIPCAGDEAECPVGFQCGAVDTEAGEQARCMPTSGSCACTEANAGQKRSCQLTNGVGTCFGVETCEPAVGWVDCSATIPAGEVCDGMDNDCNGLVDDGLGGVASCSNDVEGIGSCEGLEVCLGPQGWVCQGPLPEVELCDFSDNDCDGLVDEDFKDAAGAWTLTEHCGTCGNDCADDFVSGTGVCGGDPQAPVCVVGECDEGYVKVNDFQCLMPPDVGCQPCTSDASCFDGTCAEYDGQAVCVMPCDAGGCDDGFACEDVEGEPRCVPTSGSCTCGPLTDGATRPCQVANDLGVCVGQETCDAATGWSACSAGEAGPEVCDGADNDCNGQVDDGAEDVGAPCQNEVEGVGACDGVWVCAGQTGLVCQAAVPEVEACDFVDNDCDGNTDEDFKDVGGMWTQDGHCGTCGNDCSGKIADGTGVCGGDPAAPTCVVGTCDEGFVQLNDFQCAQPPDVSCQPCSGAGDCFDGSCVTLDGQAVCVAPCDDGGGCPAGFSCQAVGEGQRCMPDSGSCACTAATEGQVRACQVGNEVGVCLGTETCVPAVGWTGCTALTPDVESCDGLDNDCNGAIDDALAQQGQPCQNTVEDVGACDGVSICQGLSGWACQGPTPKLEECNFSDDDCDGSTDEDFRDDNGDWTLDGHCGTCGNGCEGKFDNGTGECGGVAASPVCVVAECDEGYVAPNDFQCILPPDVSCQPCAQDAVCYGGSCVEIDAQSVCVMPCDGDGGCGDGFVCQDVGGAERCVPTTGSCTCDEDSAGTVRSCQVDNDLGSCFGSQTCDAVTGWSACNAVPAVPEECDGADNDCNGLVDDGIEEGGLCFNEVEGVGACEGQLVCTAGWICQGQEPVLETCNFKDDDCDGEVDEDFKLDGAWLLDAHCGTCGNDCSTKIDNGVGTCGGSAASPVCVVASCDEGFVKVNDFQCAEPPDVSCQPCASAAECYDGTCETLDGQDVCLAPCDTQADCQPGYGCDTGRCVPLTGSCTCGADNHGAKRTCEVANAAGACFGVETCDAADGWSDCTAPTPTPETCDGFDEDCDGFIDEDVEVGLPCTNDVPGVGSCDGTTVCFGSQGLKCSGPVPTEEVCDFQDNDCDGGIDEDFKTGDDYTAFEHCSTCNSSCAVGFPNAASTECSTDGPQPQCVVTACEEGFVQLNDFQCIADVANICQSCATDANCLGADSACVALNEGSFCAKGCATVDDCPSGFVCDDVGAPTNQCVPATGSCSCDGTNTDLAVACDVTFDPPDPAAPSYTCNGQQQCTAGGWSDCQLPFDECDGIDNNCDGQTDEPFKDGTGAYTDIENCGGCGISCLALDLPNSAPACISGGALPECGFECDPGWQDVNGLSDDGCECLPQAGPDLVGDGLDTNCDGIEGDASVALFVAKNGSDSAPGTQEAPVLTIGQALAIAGAGTRDIYVATGVYSENVKLVGGVGLFGGYSADFGERDIVVYETAIIGQDPTADAPGAITALGLGSQGESQQTLLDGFTVFGANVANNAGANSYGMYISDCGPNLVIRNNRVIGGAGGNGAAGAPGSDGPDGAGGDPGDPAYDVGKISGNGTRNCSNSSDGLSGGGGGVNECPDGADLDGGRGGDALCPDHGSSPSAAEAGVAGLGAAAGQGGIAGWASNINTTNTSNCTLCVNPPGGNPHSAGFGGQGAAGSSGAAGDGCSAANGSVDGGHWLGGDGAGGNNGSHGSGGGGGGAGGGVEVTGTNCYSATGGGGDTGNCCSTSNNPGCSNQAIQDCVCAQDAFCCNNSWDSICVGEVDSFGCGTCGGGGGAPGPNIAGDDIGGSGGGGGAGGCRGLGGGGGSPGGGSFGIFVVFSGNPSAVPVIEDNEIRAGAGGAGGAGGPGGSGGVGGAGAPGGPENEGNDLQWCADAGGTGGDGGQGGHGGGGGGGCGGASFGVFAWPPAAGSAGDWAGENSFLAGGSGGLGGPGGPSLGQTGSAGSPGATSPANF